MEKKWTPGPWYCSTQSKLLRVGKVIPGSGVVICGVHRFGARGGAKCSGDPISNAHLIAAAPELADIAIEHERRLRQCAENIRDEYPLWAADLIKMADQARAVLAKARGETE